MSRHACRLQLSQWQGSLLTADAQGGQTGDTRLLIDPQQPDWAFPLSPARDAARCLNHLQMLAVPQTVLRSQQK